MPAAGGPARRPADALAARGRERTPSLRSTSPPRQRSARARRRRRPPPAGRGRAAGASPVMPGEPDALFRLFQPPRQRGQVQPAGGRVSTRLAGNERRSPMAAIEVARHRPRHPGLGAAADLRALLPRRRRPRPRRRRHRARPRDRQAHGAGASRPRRGRERPRQGLALPRPPAAATPLASSPSRLGRDGRPSAPEAAAPAPQRLSHGCHTRVAASQAPADILPRTRGPIPSASLLVPRRELDPSTSRRSLKMRKSLVFAAASACSRCSAARSAAPSPRPR